ncbi:MAG: hypothetical protein JSW73_05625 [Candidatus Woesearchaeota archaeon]|nr:MAG: hypothetical protein JSW73_05625 [Candidatus Woesearchaeota archaeon]
MVDKYVASKEGKDHNTTISNFSNLATNLSDRRHQSLERKVNDFYGDVLGVAMGVLLSSTNAKKEVADYLKTVINGVKNSYDAIEKSDLQTARQEFEKTGKEIFKIADVLDKADSGSRKIRNIVYNNYFILLIDDQSKHQFDSINQIDMSKINKEQVIGEGGIIDTYENYILPKLNN